jgi:hypothetical protein
MKQASSCLWKTDGNVEKKEKEVGKAGDNKHIPPGYEYLYLWTQESSSVFRSVRPQGGNTNLSRFFLYKELG